jgi:hypothetical protein
VIWLKFSCDLNNLVKILLQNQYITILLIRMALFFTLKSGMLILRVCQLFGSKSEHHPEKDNLLCLLASLTGVLRSPQSSPS